MHPDDTIDREWSGGQRGPSKRIHSPEDVALLNDDGEKQFAGRVLLCLMVFFSLGDIPLV